MLPIGEINYSFHVKFKSQTNIHESQNRNIKSMVVPSFSLICFKSSFYEFFWKRGKMEVVHHRKMCWMKSFSLANAANSVMCKYNFSIFFFTLFYSCRCTSIRIHRINITHNSDSCSFKEEDAGIVKWILHCICHAGTAAQLLSGVFCACWAYRASSPVCFSGPSGTNRPEDHRQGKPFHQQQLLGIS